MINSETLPAALINRVGDFGAGGTVHRGVAGADGESVGGIKIYSGHVIHPSSSGPFKSPLVAAHSVRKGKAAD